MTPDSCLLSVIRRPKPGKVSIMLDGVPVPNDPDSGPLLITSGTRPLMWLESPLKGGFVRLAVRKNEGLGSLFLSMVEAVAEEGERREWENVFPATKKGVLEATARTHYYELPSPILLHGSDFDTDLAPSIDHLEADWLHPSWAVVVPSRDYVGTVFLIGNDHLAAVLHNPSRGVCVVR